MDALFFKSIIIKNKNAINIIKIMLYIQFEKNFPISILQKDSINIIILTIIPIIPTTIVQ